MTRTTIAALTVAAVTAIGATGMALAADGDSSPINAPTTAQSRDDDSEPDDHPTPHGSSTNSTAPSGRTGGDGSAAVGRDDAVAIALARTGGGTVTEVENEVEHGRAMWKVRIVKNGTRFDVYIDKTTGGVFRFRDKGAESGDDD